MINRQLSKLLFGSRPLGLNSRSLHFLVRSKPIPHTTLQSQLLIKYPFLQQRLVSDLKVTSDLRDRSTNKSDERARKIKNVIVLGLLILFPIICVNLGNWQYKRLGWKTDLIYKLKDRVDRKAIDVQKVIIPTEEKDIHELEDDLEFTKFKLKGKFIHQEELLVGPRVYKEIRGFHVYTPFVITSEGPNKGKKIIVSRGFIGEKMVSPEARIKDNALSELAAPTGEVEIECLLRRAVHPGNAALENKKNIRLLAYVDIFDIAERTQSLPVYFQQMIDLSNKSLIGSNPIAQDGKSTAKITSWWKFWGSKGSMKVIDQDDLIGGSIHQFTENQFLRHGVPIGTTGDINIRNNHLEYLITWYSLAAISTVLIFFVVRKQKVNPMQLKLKHARRNQ